MTRYEIPEYSLVGWHNGNAQETADYVREYRALRKKKKGLVMYNGPVTTAGQRLDAKRRASA